MLHKVLKTLTITLTLFVSLQLFSQVNLTSSNLAIVKIQTNGQTIPEDEKIVADLQIIYNGQGEINYIDDTDFDYDGIIAIEKRGTSSSIYPKHSYLFETRDEEGNNLNVTIVDLPEENDWILYAPYADKSLMRNVLTYEIFNKMGWYGTRTRFCEVLLNDEYVGVYVLTEKIKRDENRVDISKLTLNDTIGDELTGGYIFRVDRHEGEGWFSQYNDNVYFGCRYPEGDKILPVQKEYIQQHVDSLEDLLYIADSTLIDSIITKINVDNFLDFIIVNELAKNVDAYRLSTYLNKDKDSKDPRIHFGPVWDFNLAYGNYHDLNAYDPSDFVYSDSTFIPYALFWFRKLLGINYFHDRFKVRWDSLNDVLINKNSLYSIIDSAALELEDAQARNFEKWDILGKYIWPNYFIGETYEEEVDYLKDWIEERLEWLNQEILAIEENPLNLTGDNEIIRLYPNPVNNQLNIQFLTQNPTGFQFFIYNSQGVKLYESIMENYMEASGNKVIDISNLQLNPGIYIIKCIIDNEEVITGKFIKS